MIRRLVIRAFGHFSARSFDFGPVTVFIGPNESGKSTLFDVLYQEVCKPKGTQIRRLKDRYGEVRDAELMFDERPIEIDSAEFLGLFAIRSGDIHLDLPKKGQWMDRVRTALFSGGVDPSRLADELGSLASDKGSLKHVREYRSLQKQSEELQEELESLQIERDRILVRQQEVESSEDEVRGMEKELEASESQLQVIERRLTQQNLIRRRKRLLSVFQDLELLDRLDRELQTLSAKTGDTSDLTRLQSHAEQTHRELDRCRMEREQRRERLARLEARTTDLAEDLLRRSRQGGLAAELRHRLEKEASSVRNGISKLWLLAVSLPVVAGVVVASILPLPTPARIMIAVGGLGLAAALAAATRGLGWRGSSIEEAIQRVSQEWMSRGGEGPLHMTSYEGLLTELTRIESSRDTASRILEQSRQEVEAEAAAFRKTDLTLADARAANERAQQAVQSWLSARGLSTEAELAAAVARAHELERSAVDLRERLGAARQRLDCATDAALRAEVGLQIHNLDGEITQAELSERDFQKLNTERKRLVEKTGMLRARRATDGDRVAEARGAVRGSLGTLPERILDCESRLNVCRNELADRQLKREAASVAQDIFRQLSRDSEVMLKKLAGEISSCYGAMLGGDRPVSLDRLDMSQARVLDAGGAERDLAQLSTGTRDSFLLAARLTLAGRSRDGESLIVLDEPFHALDRSRTEQALEVVARFQAAKDWQVVLLTKEPWMEQVCRSVFSDLRVHKLA